MSLTAIFLLLILAAVIVSLVWLIPTKVRYVETLIIEAPALQLYDNTLARPFNVILRLTGIVRWTRSMHVKDLQGLKRYSEPPFFTYIGQPVSAASTSSSVAS